jgi:hypothetical protein
MKRAIIHAISERTDREWPRDHPLRAQTIVLGDEALSAAQGFLICSKLGEPRLPPADGDRDVTKRCICCIASIVHRASAAPHLVPICAQCWTLIEAGQPFPLVDDGGAAP